MAVKVTSALLQGLINASFPPPPTDSELIEWAIENGWTYNRANDALTDPQGLWTLTARWSYLGKVRRAQIIAQREAASRAVAFLAVLEIPHLQPGTAQ